MIDPTGADLKRYLAEDPGGPVVMLNLLRFRPDGGRERYAEYLEHFRRTSIVACLQRRSMNERLITHLRHVDLAVPDHRQAWDAVLLVRYPSRQSFSDMVRDPDYQAGSHLRTEALVEAVLQPTTAWA